MCVFNVDDINTWSKFHQHFKRAICANILAPKITILCFEFDFFGTKVLAKKARVKC